MRNKQVEKKILRCEKIFEMQNDEVRNVYSNEIKCSRKDSDFYLLVIISDRECSFIREMCSCIREMCSCIQRNVSLFSF
jgi:hypothetical protein